ncbi:MAG: hypothetical protein ACK5YA_00770 [bacterium]
MTNINNDFLKNNLLSLLSPEVLDSPKIIACFNEKLEANVTDLLSTVEISKLFNGNKQKFIEIIKELDFFTLNEDSTLKLLINEEIHVISIINTPHTWKSEEIVLNILGNDSEKVKRFYKKSMFWYIVTDSKTDIESIVSGFSGKNFEDVIDGKIKFEIMSHQEIHKNLFKQVSSNTYCKETSGLKSNHNSNHDASSKLSWRKKSNDTTEDFKRGSNMAKNSGTFQRSGITTGVVRDRYNSDGQQNVFRPNQGYKRSDEIEIDLSKIHYSLKIKHKYSNADVLLLYDKYRINKIFDNPPNFENFIEDVCAQTKRKEFNFLKRERSMTYSSNDNYKSIQEVKLNLDAPAFKLPNQNPLSTGKLSNIQLNK